MESMGNYSLIFIFVSLAKIFSEICGDSRIINYDNRNLIDLKDIQKNIPHRELIKPKIYHENKQLETTLQQQGKGHHRDITIDIYAFGRRFVLDLKLNTNLFGSAYVEKRVYESHQRYTHHSVNHTEQHCYYHGALRASSSSSSSFSSTAAISTCNGIRGQFTVKNDIYSIEPAADSGWPSLSSVHFVIRNSDVAHRNRSCGNKQGEIDDRRMKRSDREAQIVRSKDYVRVFEPSDSDDDTRYVELYVVNDFTQYSAFNRKADEVFRRTKDIINIVSSIYRPLNIYVILVGIEVWTEQNFVDVNGHSEETLNQFLEYRRKYINPFYRNDNAQLIIGRDLGDGIVGKAPMMTICTYKLSGGVNADRRSTLGSIATTVSHEMGHNFGLPHDNTGVYQPCECEESSCVMSSGGGQLVPTKWSSCSKQVLSDAFHQGMDYCLRNVPERVSVGAVCGDGFVEDGEECDCGLERDCKSLCCNASTCRLAPNATCASGKCCNLATCQPFEPASVCRKSCGFCDLPEFCDGKSELCPSDVFREDGVECEDRAMTSFCYRGSCRTHDSQCQMLWGRTGRMSTRLCFDRLNVMGSGYGHCGFNWVDESFKKCEQKDVLCGMLHCEHRSEKIMFWKEALMRTMPDTPVYVDGIRKDCKAAIMDVGLDMPDPGMAFDGVKCGEKQMCLSHRCVAIETLNAPICPNCNGHGVCNSLGQCHCDLDYGPPYCHGPGIGGSEHSGPAQRYPPSDKGLALGLCLFFLVVLPFCVALIVLTYRNYDCLKFFGLQWCRRCQSNSFFKGKVPRSSRDVDLSPPEVAVDGSGDTATANSLKPSSVRRAVSFRPEDISRPLLQSSTNSSLDVVPSDKAQVAPLRHANSCSASSARDDRDRTVARANPKIANVNASGNHSFTHRAGDGGVGSASATADLRLLPPKQHDDESGAGSTVPLRPAPPPPYACPKKIATGKNSMAAKLPVNYSNSSKTESGTQHSVPVIAQSRQPPSIQRPSIQSPSIQSPSIRSPSIQSPSIQSPSIRSPSIQSPSIQPPSIQPPSIQPPSIQRPSIQSPSIQPPSIQPPSIQPPSIQPPSVASADGKIPGNGEVSRRKVTERKTFDKSTDDRPTKKVSKPQINSVSQLRSSFEGNNSSANSPSDVPANGKTPSSFQPSRPKDPPSVGRVSSPPLTAEPSKPAVPRRPPLGRPETFSAGTRVKPTGSHLQHHASEVGASANKRPSMAPKP